MGIQPEHSKSSSRPAFQQIMAQYWPLFAAGLLFIAIEWPILRDWWNVWLENESYYSHGPLVPFIAAFMAWMNRNRLSRSKISRSWFGLVLLIASIPVHAIGILMELRVLYVISFFLFAFGILLWMLGKQVTKILLVPVMFLVTMMPIASWVLDEATAKLQLISAATAAKLLLLTSGHDVVNSGNYIVSDALPGGTLLVGSPCSGLRLLISLITFCWFFIYVVRGSWKRKTLLFALSIPLSIFINALRITMIGYVGFWTESSEAVHRFHDYSGYISLVVCFVILFGIAKLLKIGDFRIHEVDSSDTLPSKRWMVPIGGDKGGIAILVILMLTAASNSFFRPLYDVPKGSIGRQYIPNSFGQWIGQNMPIEKQTRRILGKGDLLSRDYVDSGDNGRHVNVFVDAALDISAFHDPHWCLPGGGNPISDDRAITIDLGPTAPGRVRATMLETSGDYGSSIIIYWYMAGKQSYPTTKAVVEANRLSKLNDFRHIMSNPASIPKLRNDVLSRQFVWYRFSTEILDGETDEQFLRSFIRDFISHVGNFAEERRGTAK